MDYIVIFIILFLLFLLFLWYYNRNNNKKINNAINAIKNEITITLDNMSMFINNSSSTKKILLETAKKYNHNDIISLLSK